jgi:spermidine dehydrogenase
MSNRCPHFDGVFRRDFLEGALVAQQNTWPGYTGEGDYKLSAGNTESVVHDAHLVRDGAYDQVVSQVTDTGEIYDCAVVGGGLSGLSAALFFHQRTGAKRNCIVLDNAAIFGGVAKRNEFEVDGHRLYAPQASVHFQPPYPNSFLSSVYEAMGMDWGAFKSYQQWQGPSPKMSLARSPYGAASINGKPAFGFFFGPGKWVKDPWGKNLEGTPFSEQTRKELLALHFDRPTAPHLVYDYPGDAASRALDSMTIEDYLVRTYGVSRETIRLDRSEVADGFGLGPDVLSAFLVYEWEKTVPTIDNSMETGIQMFPGGNSGMARLMVKTLIPQAFDGRRTMEAVWKNPLNFGALDVAGQPVRLRLNATAVRVEHVGEPKRSEFVSITYLRDGRLQRIQAKSVVMAGGGWITKHVVRDLDASRRKAYDQFYYSPYLLANVAVRNWRFLYDLGLAGAGWFEGFGNGFNVRRCANFGVDTPVVGPDMPTVITLGVDFAKPGLPIADQGHAGRSELLSTSFAEYEKQIREQLSQMFGASGFDAKRDIAGIVLNRWGHAFINPQPGFFFGLNGGTAPRAALRDGPFGRIAFAHSDLSGAMDHRNAFIESNRAVNQLLDRVLV